MSMMVSFVLSFFPRDVLDEILNLIESVSEDFPSYSSITVCVYISSLIQSAYFLSLFELVSLKSKQLYAFKAYILLLHVFSSRATLTLLRV